jgi:hypothetical protein
MFYETSLIKNGIYLLNLKKPVYNINNKRLKTSHENMTHI